MSNNENNSISLEMREKLVNEGIVTNFFINKKTKCIVAQLNHLYGKKIVVSDIDKNWIKTIKAFTIQGQKKGVTNKHIEMLTDALDDNHEKIIDCFLSNNRTDQDDNGHNDYNTNRTDKATEGLQLIKGKIVELFLDEVKIPYAAIKVDEHIETIPIDSKRFQDWLGAAYYYHKKISTDNIIPSKILSEEEISKIQSVLRYEANNNSDKSIGDSRSIESTKTKTLNLRIAAFVDSEETNLDDNKIFYDLCNPDWDIIKITRYGWSVEKNYPEILFKRYPIMNSQVYPLRDYPEDIMEQFMKLTNVFNDDDNKLLAEVYLISLFLLANLPKPLMIPNGTHGSGKSTFQEFIKQIVDPSAALTTAFPSDLAELVQMLSHSYVTFFDNVSEIKQLTSDQLCRAVTGSGFTKRGLYTNDQDIIYNMKRAVGYNGINVTATRPDLLDRILNLYLKPIDKRERRKLKSMQKEFERILPYLLGHIFDVLVKVLNRIGEVKLEELPRMADFTEMGELIARCLGYPQNRFADAYNRNIASTNEEAIDANPVATAIATLMTTQAVWSGKSEDLRLKLDEMISHRKELTGMLYSKGWPRTPHALSDRLNEITPNLREIGIIVHRKHDTHSKSDAIIITNNNYVPAEDLKQTSEDVDDTDDYTDKENKPNNSWE